MSDVIAPPARRPYTPRQSKADRTAHKREAVKASIPKELADELRAKALRQAERQHDNAPVNDEMVWVEVERRGDGKVSTGQFVSGVGNVHYDEGERFMTTRANADELEERRYVRFVDGPRGD